MAALQQFNTYFYKYVRTCGIICCVDLTDPNYRASLGTYVFEGSIVMAGISLVYTELYKDFESALNSASAWGIVIEVNFKLYNHDA